MKDVREGDRVKLTHGPFGGAVALVKSVRDTGKYWYIIAALDEDFIKTNGLPDIMRNPKTGSIEVQMLEGEFEVFGDVIRTFGGD